MRRRTRVVPFALAALAVALPAGAQGGEEGGLDIRTSIRATLLVSRVPDEPALLAERSEATAFWRLRIEPTWRPAPDVTVMLAYEQRLRLLAGAAPSALLAAIPAERAAPFRVRALDWSLDEGSGFAWRHEVDRASVGFRSRAANITIGRQAIGWGRGVLFGAIDLFSPFAPLEADREWRRGVDAVRADVELRERVSLDAVVASGRSFDESLAGARLRGYMGRVDLEVVGGWRARDLFGGVTSSAAIGDAEVHGELALFRAPEPLVSRSGRLALKAVGGASYQFAVGHGLLVSAEYHYSGFGAARPEHLPVLLANASFLQRIVRGDTQILARHALAAVARYELSPELALAAQWLGTPTDASGVIVPSATFTFDDKLSLVATGYGAYGRSPRLGVPRSTYGGTPLSLLVQIRLYL